MPSVDLQACDPYLRDAFLRARRTYEREHAPALVRITATHRSTKEQQELWKIGRTFAPDGTVLTTDETKIVTKVNGTTELSKHNYFPSRAIDFCVTLAGKVTWTGALYREAGPYFEAEGLRWGGNFDQDPTRKDPWLDLPHVELP